MWRNITKLSTLVASHEALNTALNKQHCLVQLNIYNNKTQKYLNWIIYENEIFTALHDTGWPINNRDILQPFSSRIF